MHISYAHAVRGLFPDDFVGRERLREERLVAVVDALGVLRLGLGLDAGGVAVLFPDPEEDQEGELRVPR